MKRLWKHNIQLVCLFLTLAFSLGAGDAGAALDCKNPALQELPVLAGGRVKPLVVHASETLRALFEKSPGGSQAATELFCKISFHEPHALRLRVDHVAIERFLKMPAGEKSIAIEDLQLQERRLMDEYRKFQAEKTDKTALGKAFSRLLYRLSLYQALDAGTSWTVPINAAGTEADWATLADFRSHLAGADSQQVLEAVQAAGRSYLQKVPSTVALELTYHRLHLISYKVLAALLGLAVVFAIQKKPVRLRFQIGSLALGASLALAIIDLCFRIRISGRGPVTNMYETVLWVGLGMGVFAGILAFVKKQPIYFLFGLAGFLLTTFMNRFAPAMVDPSIQPLVPVLRDNFWLSTHVTTVTISYAAFALSWLVADYFMVKNIFSKAHDAKEQAGFNDLAYAAIKIGVVLIATGTILGGVWADYSWGRFWGWDPKETWALITLLVYVGILHGRYAGWISNRVFLPAVGLAFLSVLMCWFGVNYVLASGLHSYGWSEHGTIFLASLAALQIAVFAVYLLKRPT